uniref:RBR-type E3 ubiquitin transferase n=1 Tax=Myotis lucifugus TaxID=59463 RepID=G1QCZ2_MYOLU
EAQEDALLGLASIYDGDEFRKAESVQGGETSIYLDLPQNFKVFVSLAALCKHLDSLWEEHRGDVVLFACMQFLKEETLITALGCLNIVFPFELRIGSQKKQRRTAQASGNTELDCRGAAGSAVDQEEVEDERAVQDVESLSNLIQEILDFDQAQQIKYFNSELFLCNICFHEKLSSECMHFLECRHVYCKACLKDYKYFEIQIKDGQVQCLHCPEPKCPSGQVNELVEAELFVHYDRLLLQSTLDLMADVVYCPFPCCQLPVMQEPGCTIICSHCNFSFCTLCRVAYHGVSPYKLTAELDGCNKMTCTACMQYFCWICMGSLNANPYKHLTDPASQCFNWLFCAADVDEYIWEDEIEG